MPHLTPGQTWTAIIIVGALITFLVARLQDWAERQDTF